MRTVTPKETKGVKVGQKVYVPELDLFGEVTEISNDVKGWIQQIKVVNSDGKVTFHEVSGLAVEAILIVDKVVASEVFKVVWNWIKNLFKKKDKRK